MAPGVIGTAHERTGLDVAKAEFVGFCLKFLEFFRRDVALDFELAIGWLQILADGDDIDFVRRVNHGV